VRHVHGTGRRTIRRRGEGSGHTSMQEGEIVIHNNPVALITEANKGVGGSASFAAS
jgi:hypothetical protein